MASNKSDDEQPANLLFWIKDGCLSGCSLPIKTDTEVSIGRANSKRALGLIVKRGNMSLDFVLNKDQVAELIEYLQYSHRRLLNPEIG